MRRNSSKIHVDALSIITKGCTNLTSLKLSGSQFIDRWFLFNTLRAVSLISTLPHLKTLHLGGYHFGAEILTDWANFAGKLQELDLSMSFPLTVMESMISEATNLRKLNISRININDHIIEHVLQKCTALTKLNVSVNEVQLSLVTKYSLELVTKSSHLKVVKCYQTWREEDILGLDFSTVNVKLVM